MPFGQGQGVKGLEVPRHVSVRDHPYYAPIVDVALKRFVEEYGKEGENTIYVCRVNVYARYSLTWIYWVEGQALILWEPGHGFNERGDRDGQYDLLYPHRFLDLSKDVYPERPFGTTYAISEEDWREQTTDCMQTGTKFVVKKEDIGKEKPVGDAEGVRKPPEPRPGASDEIAVHYEIESASIDSRAGEITPSKRSLVVKVAGSTFKIEVAKSFGALHLNFLPQSEVQREPIVSEISVLGPEKSAAPSYHAFYSGSDVRSGYTRNLPPIPIRWPITLVMVGAIAAPEKPEIQFRVTCGDEIIHVTLRIVAQPNRVEMKQ